MVYYAQSLKITHVHINNTLYSLTFSSYRASRTLYVEFLLFVYNKNVTSACFMKPNPS